MKMKFISMARDAQQAEALCECGRCGYEIYCLDPVGEAEGAYLHVDCMTAEEQEYCRMAPAIAFLEEERG